MSSFLLCIGFDDHREIERRLVEGAAITARLLPASAQPARSELGCELELGGGWFVVDGHHRAGSHPISVHRDAERLVLVIGRPGCSAHHVAETWARGGRDAVRELPGSFSAVVVDRRARSLDLVTDPIGARPLRVVRNRAAIAVATHDLPLVATGFAEATWDPISAASILGFEWSLEGRSLLRDVEVMHPSATPHWAWGGRFEEHRACTLSARRGESLQYPEFVEQLDAATDALRDSIRSDAADRDCLVSLTAGSDSRVVLALVRASIAPDQITTATSGSVQDPEVETASRIASQVGITHEVHGLVATTPHGFFERVDHLAYFHDADTCAKRALAYEGEAHDRSIRFGGQGAGHLKGTYYPSRDAEALRRMRPEDVAQSLLRASRVDALPWADDEFERALRDRFRQTFEPLQAISTRAVDLFDLFYLYERLARWANGAERNPDRAHFRTPLKEPGLARLVFALDDSLRPSLPVHWRILERFMPHGCRTLVNGRGYLAHPLERKSGRAVRRARQVAARLRRRARLRPTTPRPRGVGLSADSGTAFGSALREPIRERLMSKESLAGVLLSRDGLDALLAERNAAAIEAIGSLLTIDAWCTRIREAARLATVTGLGNG